VQPAARGDVKTLRERTGGMNEGISVHYSSGCLQGVRVHVWAHTYTHIFILTKRTAKSWAGADSVEETPRLERVHHNHIRLEQTQLQLSGRKGKSY